ncbi:hypothetical protein ACU16_03775 [Xanthomonas oryzae pv. oryzicola]|nr:hypothetical protein ACU16_03775 [Xanthomonas oryzae pv. oryzicola]
MACSISTTKASANAAAAIRSSPAMVCSVEPISMRGYAWARRLLALSPDAFVGLWMRRRCDRLASGLRTRVRYASAVT